MEFRLIHESADAQGVPLECRYMVTIPSEVAIVDIDTK